MPICLDKRAPEFNKLNIDRIKNRLRWHSRGGGRATKSQEYRELAALRPTAGLCKGHDSRARTLGHH